MGLGPLFGGMPFLSQDEGQCFAKVRFGLCPMK
jgi:hypothetical protein